MRVDPSIWDPPSCEGLLYGCCIGVVNLTFLFFFLENDGFKNTTTTITQHPFTWGGAQCVEENVRFTTPIQQLYNNPSHEGGPHIPTLM